MNRLQLVPSVYLKAAEVASVVSEGYGVASVVSGGCRSC
jgi:hypothetical protein